MIRSLRLRIARWGNPLLTEQIDSLAKRITDAEEQRDSAAAVIAALTDEAKDVDVVIGEIDTAIAVLRKQHDENTRYWRDKFHTEREEKVAKLGELDRANRELIEARAEVAELRGQLDSALKTAEALRRDPTPGHEACHTTIAELDQALTRCRQWQNAVWPDPEHVEAVRRRDLGLTDPTGSITSTSSRPGRR